MNEVSIEFRNVSLDYRLANEGGITSFKEWAIRMMTRKLTYRVMRALDDLSFEVSSGVNVGVIGHNGAGKSTLLRIAAGILQPSSGVAIMRGEVAPIIELGTGFEAELSGRENIFFNGALLGRSWGQMSDRVNDIIDFSELGDFIDFPIEPTRPVWSPAWPSRLQRRSTPRSSSSTKCFQSVINVFRPSATVG